MDAKTKAAVKRARAEFNRNATTSALGTVIGILETLAGPDEPVAQAAQVKTAESQNGE